MKKVGRKLAGMKIKSYLCSVNKEQQNKTIMKRIILTVGDLRKSIENLDDDFTIEMRVRTKVSDEEFEKRSYPYPFETEYFNGIEFDDIGYSDKVICFGVETNNE